MHSTKVCDKVFTCGVRLQTGSPVSEASVGNHLIPSNFTHHDFVFVKLCSRPCFKWRSRQPPKAGLRGRYRPRYTAGQWPSLPPEDCGPESMGPHGGSSSTSPPPPPDAGADPETRVPPDASTNPESKTVSATGAGTDPGPPRRRSTRGRAAGQPDRGTGGGILFF